MPDAADPREPGHRLTPEGVEKARREWEPWCRTLSSRPEVVAAALDAALDYLGAGLEAEVVAALLRVRSTRSVSYERDRSILNWEVSHCDRVRRELPALRDAGVVSAADATAIDAEYAARLDRLGTASTPLLGQPAVVAAAPGVPAQPGAPAPASAAPAPAATPAAPARPAAPPPSLRDLFAEHSVLILASFGAFLLVVATVLFELYGTVGLGGTGRFAAVITLNAIFALAGFFALRRPNLRAVGQIYTALAAVLLPLAGLAAWTFLELGRQGITTDQAIGVTGLACAVVYGGLAIRLRLRAYGEMSGVAIFAAAFGLAGAVAGETWRPLGLAVAPFAYAACERYLRTNVLSHFPWFAHATALVAVLLALNRSQPSGWLLTSTLTALAIAYLAWQAIAPHRSRAWIGEAGLVLAAATASGPLGVSTYHFVLPMLLGIPLVLLARAPERLGAVGRLYRPHAALLHLAIGSGVLVAAAENAAGESWPLAAALWYAFAFYTIDFSLGRDEATGYALRTALPLAIVATAQALGFGPWTAPLVALTLVAYLAAWRMRAGAPLQRHASYFFYGVVALAALNLDPLDVTAGHWQITATLLILAAGFAAASELKAVPLADWAARATFSIAWFAAVDALDAKGWRGPFDAALPLFYTALAQVRTLRDHPAAVRGRRWFVNATAVIAVGLCFAGPPEQLWWRLTLAFGLLAAAYWWQEMRESSVETPWLAWVSIASTVLSLAVAAASSEWQGTFVIFGAVVLTGAWAALRRRRSTVSLEESGFVVVSVLTLTGVGMALRQPLPQWQQAAGAMGAAGYALAWSELVTSPTLRPASSILRSAAAALASAAVLCGAAVLRLDAAYVGLVALGMAAAHAEWSLRARAQVERWYGTAAVIALAVFVYFWPYAHAIRALSAVEFVAFACLLFATGILSRRWYLAYPASLLLVPALDQALAVFVPRGDAELEESWMAGLAWAIGLAGLSVRPLAGRMWAIATEAAAATVAAIVLLTMASGGHPDPAGIALLAYAPQVYTAAMQERQRWLLPVAAATALAGAVVLLAAHGADTIYYPAVLGALGLAIWVAGRVTLATAGGGRVVEMHRYLGLGMLAASALAGFFFPDRTGAGSVGAVLAGVALLVTGAVMWLDAHAFSWRPNRYLAMFTASCAGYFAARYVSLEPWALVVPGIGAIACGILLRQDQVLVLDRRIRRLIVAFGLGLVMGWAAVLTTSGDLYWLVVLLVEGVVAIAAGIVLRSRVLVGGGGAAVAAVSLRALLTIAQAGYLFAAFAAVAIVLLVLATALALGRDRFLGGARGMREQLAHWD